MSSLDCVITVEAVWSEYHIQAIIPRNCLPQRYQAQWTIGFENGSVCRTSIFGLTVHRDVLFTDPRDMVEKPVLEKPEEMRSGIHPARRAPKSWSWNMAVPRSIERRPYRTTDDLLRRGWGPADNREFANPRDTEIRILYGYQGGYTVKAFYKGDILWECVTPGETLHDWIPDLILEVEQHLAKVDAGIAPVYNPATRVWESPVLTKNGMAKVAKVAKKAVDEFIEVAKAIGPIPESDYWGDLEYRGDMGTGLCTSCGISSCMCPRPGVTKKQWDLVGEMINREQVNRLHATTGDFNGTGFLSETGARLPLIDSSVVEKETGRLLGQVSPSSWRYISGDPFKNVKTLDPYYWGNPKVLEKVEQIRRQMKGESPGGS